MVFQHFALLPHKNVRENVEYGLKIQGIDDEIKKQKAYEMLEVVGLKGYEEKMPNELSGGMKQRVGLARALANEPEVLLMDEAFSALDPLIRKEMQNELLSLQSSLQKTIIFITHDLDEALKLGDRIAIMKDGEIVQIDTPENILENPANDYVREFVQDVNRAKVITASNIMRKPKCLIKEYDGPSTAVREMNKEELETAFVVNKNHTLSGYIEIEEATALIRKGEKSISSIIKKANTITPDTLIDDLLPDVVHSTHHLAVTNDDGKLLGSIGKTAILTGLLGKEDYNV
jgi:glycine betaine/proline transport system ATP-binding protein